MVSNCANPACAVPLRYLRDGRLFQFEVRPQKDAGASRSRVPRSVTHFWLCGDCASKLTLVFDQLKAVVLKPTIAA